MYLVFVRCVNMDLMFAASSQFFFIIEMTVMVVYGGAIKIEWNNE